MSEFRPLRPVPHLVVAFALGLALMATYLARSTRPGARPDTPLVADAVASALGAMPLAHAGVLTVSVPASGNLTARLYDPAGTLVRVLVEDEPHAKGAALIAWDGCDADGRPAPDGAYALKLEVKSARVRAMRMTRLHWPARANGA